MSKINSQKDMRVTAKVMGVIKPMNKTYGGSILKPQDQAKQTKEKFDLFLRNLNIPAE